MFFYFIIFYIAEWNSFTLTMTNIHGILYGSSLTSAIEWIHLTFFNFGVFKERIIRHVKLQMFSMKTPLKTYKGFFSTWSGFRDADDILLLMDVSVNRWGQLWTHACAGGFDENPVDSFSEISGRHRRL